MRTLILSMIFLCLSLTLSAQMPAAISIEPATATAYDTLTLIFNPNLACFQGESLEGLDSIAMHSGVSYLSGPSWMNIIEYNETGMNNQASTLYPTGDGRFAITFVPFEYYGFPEGTVITEICAVFNNGMNWDQDGRDFIAQTEDCNDFFIPLAISTGCPSESLVFSSQAQIDNFKINYPLCSEFENNIEINGDDIYNLNGLNEIISIAGDLHIGRLQGGGNIPLKNLSGLDSLSSIGGGLKIYGNDSLSALSGLERLSSVGIIGISIYNNQELTTCDISSICDFLANTPESVHIENNSEGCNSTAEVEEACEYVSSPSFKNPKLLIAPNPFKNTISIEYTLMQAEQIHIEIFNGIGKLVCQFQEDQSPGFKQFIWNAKRFPKGGYYYRIKVGEQILTGKIVKWEQ